MAILSEQAGAEAVANSFYWTRDEAATLFRLPFNDLLLRAHTVHRQNFEANTIQLSQLLSIKTGGCPEDCGYCSQSARAPTGLAASKLMEIGQVIEEARRAKMAGAMRYCMGAAWRGPKDRDIPALRAMIEGVKALGLETCMTLGKLSRTQARELAAAGLDYYNHNIDSSESYYREVVTTHSFAERLDTLAAVREAGIKICCGGILGMGEGETDRLDMLVILANLDPPPESVPINMLMPIPGTRLEASPRLKGLDFVRAIAAARIMMPTSVVRLSAGRMQMSDELQALCFFAGANSIFIGDTLLTAGNPTEDKDRVLFQKLGLKAIDATGSP